MVASRSASTSALKLDHLVGGVRHAEELRRGETRLGRSPPARARCRSSCRAATRAAEVGGQGLVERLHRHHPEQACRGSRRRAWCRHRTAPDVGQADGVSSPTRADLLVAAAAAARSGPRTRAGGGRQAHPVVVTPTVVVVPTEVVVGRRGRGGRARRPGAVDAVGGPGAVGLGDTQTSAAASTSVIQVAPDLAEPRSSLSDRPRAGQVLLPGGRRCAPTTIRTWNPNSDLHRPGDLVEGRGQRRLGKLLDVVAGERAAQVAALRLVSRETSVGHRGEVLPCRQAGVDRLGLLHGLDQDVLGADLGQGGGVGEEPVDDLRGDRPAAPGLRRAVRRSRR